MLIRFISTSSRQGRPCSVTGVDTKAGQIRLRSPKPRMHTLSMLHAGSLESHATIDLAFSHIKALTVTDPLAAQTQKDKDGLIDALYIFGIEMPDAVYELIFWYCGDLINHEARKRVETVAFVRRNRNAKQRRLSWIRCHDADRDGFCGLETVIL